MVLSMKASGKTTCNMAKVLKNGLMDPSTLAITLLEGNTESALTNGMTAANTQVTGLKTKFLE